MNILRNCYVLDAEHHVVKPSSLMEWGEFMCSPRRVAYTRITDEIEVITSFIGIDHRFFGGKGPPIVFETMIFGGPLDGYQWRYSSWDDAEIGHQMAVKKMEHANG